MSVCTMVVADLMSENSDALLSYAKSNAALSKSLKELRRSSFIRQRYSAA